MASNKKNNGKTPMIIMSMNEGRKEEEEKFMLVTKLKAFVTILNIRIGEKHPDLLREIEAMTNKKAQRSKYMEDAFENEWKGFK